VSGRRRSVHQSRAVFQNHELSFSISQVKSLRWIYRKTVIASRQLSSGSAANRLAESRFYGGRGLRCLLLGDALRGKAVGGDAWLGTGGADEQLPSRSLEITFKD
jgi:hypothetical protein